MNITKYILFLFLFSAGSECKVDVYGVSYDGKTNSTESGRDCQNWSSQIPHKHSFEWVGDLNYCRNPDGKAYGPWCYTLDEKTTWEYCNVPLCGEITFIFLWCIKMKAILV